MNSKLRLNNEKKFCQCNNKLCFDFFQNSREMDHPSARNLIHQITDNKKNIKNEKEFQNNCVYFNEKGSKPTFYKIEIKTS